MITFTKTEKAILDVLSDGKPHKAEELVACLDDEMADMGAVHTHLDRIRKKLPEGQIILCQFLRRARQFRLVRRLKQG